MVQGQDRRTGEIFGVRKAITCRSDPSHCLGESHQHNLNAHPPARSNHTAIRIWRTVPQNNLPLVKESAKIDSNMHNERAKTAVLAGITGAGQMEAPVKNISRNSKSDGQSVERFCRLTVIRKFRSKGRLVAECKCDCGTMKTATLSHLVSGGVKSCGCLKLETSRRNGLANKRHGQSSPGNRTHTYRTWETIKSRCINSSDPSFPNYGLRGIKVCARWMKFENFFADMGERPGGMTLDRKDTNGDYCKMNCRWSTAQVQQRNKRTNRIVLFRGENVPLVVVSEQTGISYDRLWQRIVRRGWSVEDAISKPSIGYA